MSSLSDHAATMRRVDVLDSGMAYSDRGEGPPIVFLHGNPTSSILWRDVIPQVSRLGRCVAPDLIGMGLSDKRVPRPESYRFVEHRRYLDAFLEAIDLGEEVTLVLHDWGSALGFDWAARHPELVRAIVYMESIVAPLQWSDWDPQAVKAFQAMRSEAGEQMVLENNFFVERILPSAILRALTEEERDAYRQPFVQAEDRWPTLVWPRELPFDEPTDVVEIVANYSRWLSRSEVPKLFVNAEPGSILTGRPRDLCRTWPNQTEITVPGVHFVQEDSGSEIGRQIADWLPGTG